MRLGYTASHSFSEHITVFVGFFFLDPAHQFVEYNVMNGQNTLDEDLTHLNVVCSDYQFLRIIT